MLLHLTISAPARPIATILRGAILISCLLAAVVQVQVIALASQNDKARAIAAVDIIGAVSDDILSQLQGLAGLILAVVFFYWLYRGTQNLQCIGVLLCIWPIGAVGWWFVPIAFFWKPYAALSQLWLGHLYGRDWIRAETPRALRTWLDSVLDRPHPQYRPRRLCQLRSSRQPRHQGRGSRRRRSLQFLGDHQCHRDAAPVQDHQPDHRTARRAPSSHFRTGA